MKQEINRIRNKRYEKETIHIYWVHSHDISKMNQKVDNAAKEASNMVMVNHSMTGKINLLCPNSYISQQTIKAEINYRTMKYDDSKWSTYKYMKKETYGAHYYNLNISWNPKKYSDEMQYMDGNENIIRLMLLTNQIPTNWFMVHEA